MGCSRHGTWVPDKAVAQSSFYVSFLKATSFIPSHTHSLPIRHLVYISTVGPNRYAIAPGIIGDSCSGSARVRHARKTPRRGGHSQSVRRYTSNTSSLPHTIMDENIHREKLSRRDCPRNQGASTRALLQGRASPRNRRVEHRIVKTLGLRLSIRSLQVAVAALAMLMGSGILE